MGYSRGDMERMRYFSDETRKNAPHIQQTADLNDGKYIENLLIHKLGKDGYAFSAIEAPSLVMSR